MTDNQLLHKALKKCGWAIDVKDNQYVSYNHPLEIIFSHDFAKAFWGEEEYYDEKPEKIHLHQEWYGSQGIMGEELSLTEKAFIKKFNKIFLKKIQENNGGTVGKHDDWFCNNYWERYKKEGWQHYLQQMVLEKEPLKYLEKFLDKE